MIALVNPSNPFTPIARKATRAAAEKLGLQVQAVQVQGSNDLDAALAVIGAAAKRISRTSYMDTAQFARLI